MSDTILSDIERRELGLLLRDPKFGSSDRERDRARTRLKRLGFIRFDRKAWEWEVLPGGRAVLEEGMKLYGEMRRALRFLSERPAHELQEKPIAILTEAVSLGYAERRPYTSRRKSGKIDLSWETTITEAGREALGRKA